MDMSRHPAPVSQGPRTAYPVFTPDTDERALVREHLERILASAVFRNSKRYAAVLRYVVERTLDGNPEQLKERTIGVDVFGRESDYDTASDHVVRSAVAEIRKRLAQHYQYDDDAPLRIELPLGSYVPQFRRAIATSTGSDDTPVVKNSPATLLLRATRRRRVQRMAAAITFLCLALVCTGLLMNGRVINPRAFGPADDPVAEFWKPVFASPSQVLLCIGNLEGGRRSALKSEAAAPLPILTVRDFHHSASNMVHMGDATTLARFAGLLEANRKPYRIATQSEADFTDLQSGPAILIGLMNNDWTERLVGKLRFKVERPAPGKVIIRDTANPSSSDWSMDYTTPIPEVTRDYALVLRVLDPKTDQMVVTAAGISAFGTLAAGEFLTSARALTELKSVAPRDWNRKNAEIVLSTEMIRGKSGRPSIVATHFW
jgi:hypothetical protein